MTMIIISMIGVIAALIEIGFAIYTYSNESVRKRRSETIIFYNKIFNETYKLRDKYFNVTKKYLFTSEDIYNNENIYKHTLNFLTLLEGFAKGLEYGVYDFKTFVYLTPNELFEILNSLSQFVYDEQRKKAYNLLFNDFLSLVNVMSICVRYKQDGRKITFNYSKIKKKKVI